MTYTTLMLKDKKQKYLNKQNGTAIPIKNLGKVMAELIMAHEGEKAFWQNKSF